MEQNVKENYEVLNSSDNKLKDCKSHCSEIVILKSEKKYVEEVKEVKTIPTSESSSIKCSSVTSQHEQKKDEQSQHKTKTYDGNGEWRIQNNKKNKNSGKKTTRGKKGKQHKNKGRQNKKQPQ